MNLVIYFYTHVIIIKSVILVVIISITLANKLINVNYLHFTFAAFNNCCILFGSWMNVISTGYKE